MITQDPRQLTYTFAVVDGLALSLAFALAFSLRSLGTLAFIGSPANPVLSEHLWMPILAVPLFWSLASHKGLYRPPWGENGSSGIVWVCLRLTAYLGLLLGTAVFALQAKTFSRTVFFLFLLLAFLFTAGGRILLRFSLIHSRRGVNACRRLLVVGINSEARELVQRIAGDAASFYQLVGCVPGFDETPTSHRDLRVLGRIEDLKRIVEEEVVDEVIFALPPSQLLRCEKQIGWCEEVGKTVHLKVDFGRTLFAKTYVAQWEGTPILTVSTTPQDPLALLAKRLVDVVASALGLIILFPVLTACALAIKLNSKGPVLFQQKRVGLNGRLFALHKFRSMRVDAEKQREELAGLNEASGPVFKIRRDPRVTAVGRLLRRFSLDEIPQLWNVLRGDMSLVGPRPPIPTEVVEYERWQKRRLSMKPGMTCLWQVSGRSEVPFEEWMKLDLAYIDNWSLKLDMIILLRTVPAVLLSRGAH